VFDDHGVTVLPGAREILAWTQAYPRALVTGSSRVEALQVLPRIGPMASSRSQAEDAHSKPHPAGYQAAMAAGLAPQCLVVGIR
jgi:beta-phosphoglucomutase-like phosphatase (HAD superfamily)